MAVQILGVAITAAAIVSVVRIAIRAAVVYLGVVVVGTGAMLVLLNQAAGIIEGMLQGLPEGPANILGILRFDEAVNIIFYGFGVRFTLAGFRRVRLIP